MRVSLTIFFTFFLVACSSIFQPETPTSTPAPASSELIKFESLTFPGHLWKPFMPLPEEGTKTAVTGILTIPAGSGRLPAVIITHGCGSITSGETGWATRLNELGIATLLVHSFGSRNIPEVCTGQHQVNIASVLADAYAALDIVAENPRIDPSRIAILGLSFGGRTALWSSMERFQERYSSGRHQFAAYLAFYPASCYMQLVDEEQVSGGPIRIFHGAADDWIPIGPCKSYIERLRQAGVDADLFEYPEALHSFDNPRTVSQIKYDALSPANCAFIEQDSMIIDPETGAEAGIDSPCVQRGVSLGYNAEAERQAVQDVTEFLKGVFEMD